MLQDSKITNPRGSAELLRHLMTYETKHSKRLLTQPYPPPAAIQRPQRNATEAAQMLYLKQEEIREKKHVVWDKEQILAKSEILDPLSEGVKRDILKGGPNRDFVSARADEIYSWLVEYSRKSPTGEKEVLIQEIFAAGFDSKQPIRDQIEAITDGLIRLQYMGFELSREETFGKAIRYFTEMPGFLDQYLTNFLLNNSQPIDQTFEKLGERLIYIEESKENLLLGSKQSQIRANVTAVTVVEQLAALRAQIDTLTSEGGKQSKEKKPIPGMESG
jgi:hypothetical protein